MSERSTRSERKLLNEVADRYRTQGYRVSVRPGSAALPTELKQFQVDLLATRGDDKVIIEVKRGTAARAVSRQLERLTAVASDLGWRVDLVSEPEPEGATLPRARRRALLEDALNLLEDEHKEAAVLLASSVLEGTLRALAGKHRALPEREATLRQLIDLLRSNGLLGAGTSDRLSSLVQARNHTAHAKSLGRLAPADIGDSIRVALWLDDTAFITPDEMADWFFERFEDPAEWVPYDSGEGGYQYPAGEPHDARDVLTDEFRDAPEVAIEDTLELIEPLGTEWVAKDSL